MSNLALWDGLGGEVQRYREVDPGYIVPDISVPAEVIENTVTIERMRELQAAIPKMTDTIPTNSLTGHEFCDGLYCRKYFLPKGVIAVSLMHAHDNFFVVASGEMMVWGPEGQARLKAPYMTVTKPGTKRIVYGIEDTLILTFHPNPDNGTDLRELRDRLIIPELGAIEDGKAHVPHLDYKPEVTK